MARIDKAEHPRILQMVDGEHRKVAEVAAEFGCSPANIYALLTKLRRGEAPETLQAPVLPSPVPEAADLFATIPPIPEPVPIPKPVAAPKPAKAAKPPAPPPKPVMDEPAPRGGVKRRAALAKPGVGLVMRTAEGEEGLTPFRSLDDLLSAVKPILRAAARSPDPVWFSIQTIDLAALDSDAA